MQEADAEYSNYLAGIDAVSFVGTTVSGRELSVIVPWKMIEKIAHWGLKALDSDNRRHMFWHMEYPDSAFPCELCPKGVE